MYSKWPLSGTSQKSPEPKPQRSKMATRRGSWTVVVPVGLTEKLMSTAAPQAWRDSWVEPAMVRGLKHP